VCSKLADDAVIGDHGPDTRQVGRGMAFSNFTNAGPMLGYGQVWRNFFMIVRLTWMAGLVAMMMTLSSASQAQGTTHMARDHLVVDLRFSIEWLRCTVGQVWDGTGCTGEVVRLDHEQTAMAIDQANEQLGEGWRLPTREELEGLVCEDCGRPMIDEEMFPATLSEPYWTGEQNLMSKRHYFSVNFFNGWTNGRSHPTKPLATRFVRDRR
jgi:hypothetical protein